MSFLVNLNSQTITPMGLAILYMTDSKRFRSGDRSGEMIGELFAFFDGNEELAVNFLACFGGQTIHVPRARAVHGAFMSARAYLRCNDLAKFNCREDVVDQVAAELDMTKHDVRLSWDDVGKLLVRLDREMKKCLESGNR